MTARERFEAPTVTLIPALQYPGGDVILGYRRHGELLRLMRSSGFTGIPIQGFWTVDLGLISRLEAAKLAIAAGIVLQHTEDLW